MANQATAKKGEEVVEGQVLLNNDNIVDFSKYRDERKAKSTVQIEESLDSISQELTSNPEKQKKVREVIEKNIVLGEELMTGEENIRAVAEAAYGDEEITPEIEMAAKKATEAAKGMVLKDPLGTRLYREQKIEDELATISDNLSEREKELLKKGSIGDTTSEKEQELLKRGLLNRKRKLAQEIVSAAGIENYEQKIMDTFPNEPSGNTEEAVNKVTIVKGLGMMPKEKREIVLKENERINSELRRFQSNVPYNEISKKVLALDNVSAHLNRSEASRRFLNSFQGSSGGFLMRFKMIFYRLSGGQIGGGETIHVSNGFTTQIGGQPTSAFVQDSVGLLLKNSDGLGQVFAAMANGGTNLALRAATKGAVAKLAAGALGGPVGLAAGATVEFVKKIFGGLGEKLAPGVKNGLANTFDKMGGGLMKAAVGVGVLLASIGGLGLGLGAAAASTAVIGVTAGATGFIAYNQYIIPTNNNSALLTVKKGCESDMEYVNTMSKPKIPCSNMDQYTEEMRQKILDIGYQTRCAVVVAAQYMIYDFPYHVGYHLGGYGEGDMGIDDDWCDGAMDCAGFIRWAYRQGGFAITKQTSTTYWEGGAINLSTGKKTRVRTFFRTNTLNFVPSNCAQIKERVKEGDIVRHGRFSEDGSMHAAMVIGIDDTRLQIAQEGGSGGKGLNTCFIDICTGKGRGVEHGCGNFDRISLMDNFFEYYEDGGAINGYPIRPYSENIQEFPEYDKKK